MGGANFKVVSMPGRDSDLDSAKVQASIAKRVDSIRKQLLRKLPPRDKCPGCFVAIYDRARKDGWCTGCNPSRHPR